MAPKIHSTTDAFKKDESESEHVILSTVASLPLDDMQKVGVPFWENGKEAPIGQGPRWEK